MSEPNMVELLDLDEEELFEAFGSSLFAGDHAVSAGDLGRYGRMASEWLDARRDQVRDAVCPKRMRKMLTGDVAADSAVLVSALSGFFVDDHSAWLLAAIVLRRGVNQFCAKR